MCRVILSCRKQRSSAPSPAGGSAGSSAGRTPGPCRGSAGSSAPSPAGSSSARAATCPERRRSPAGATPAATAGPPPAAQESTAQESTAEERIAAGTLEPLPRAGGDAVSDSEGSEAGPPAAGPPLPGLRLTERPRQPRALQGSFCNEEDPRALQPTPRPCNEKEYHQNHHHQNH